MPRLPFIAEIKAFLMKSCVFNEILYFSVACIFCHRLFRSISTLYCSISTALKCPTTTALIGLGSDSAL